MSVHAIRNHRANPSSPASALIYFHINLFLFYLPTEIPTVAGCAAAASQRDATSTVNRKPCGIVAILSRMRVSTCTRRSYARRSKYGNAFTRNVFTGISRNTKFARGLPNGLQTSLIVLDGGEKPSSPQRIFRTACIYREALQMRACLRRVRHILYLKATSLLNNFLGCLFKTSYAKINFI